MIEQPSRATVEVFSREMLTTEHILTSSHPRGAAHLIDCSSFSSNAPPTAEIAKISLSSPIGKVVGHFHAKVL